MKLPFTVEQFFEVFARYNNSVWPVQIFLNLLALLAIVLLFRSSSHKSRVISGILSFLWAWMAIAYHFAFFTAINPASWLFGVVFLVGALCFLGVGVLKSRLLFSIPVGMRGWIGGLLLILSLVIYPLLGYVFGHRYPAVPTFGLPCPTTIFTLGISLFAVAPLPRFVFIIPLLWSLVGSMAAFQLGVPQDFSLLAAGFIGLVAVIFPPHLANSPLQAGATLSPQR